MLVESCDFLFQAFVDVLSAADEADTTHAETVGVNGLLCTFSNLGVVGESKIVVSTEVQYSFATLDLDLRRL